MQYITHTRCRIKSISGDVNIPATTPVERIGDMLYYDGKPLCAVRSQNSLDFFCRDDDGNGMERGKLTKSIMVTLKERRAVDDPAYQARWDKVWDDKLVCPQYKRPEHADYWLWNQKFFDAPLDDLRYIAKLVGAKGGTAS